MAGRYVCSSVQLAMFIEIRNFKDRKKLLNEIIKFQWLEESDEPTMADIKMYRELLKEAR